MIATSPTMLDPHGPMAPEGCVMSSGAASGRPGRVALAHVQALGHASAAQPGVECSIDWAGPVEAPMEDEATVQAACGIMHVHGRRSGAPQALGVDYASTVTGVLAAQGVLAALVAEARGMPLRRVATSVAQGALLAVSQYVAAATADDEWEEAAGAGGPPFTSADEVRFEIEALEASGWERFWAHVGADPAAIRSGWRPFLHRYATATCPLPDSLHQTTRRKRFAALDRAATEAGIGIQRVRSAAEARRGRDAGMVPWTIASMAERAGARPLARGRSSARLPLEEFLVIDAGTRVQGPLAAHMLGLLGARVIRIEPPGGDPMRGMPPLAGDVSARFVALNRGKQVVEIDLKSPAGRDAVRDLVSGADVFVHNRAPGRASELGIATADLARACPGLVYAWASGWGDAFGPRPPVGTDFQVQAYSGLAAEVGPSDEAPAPSLMTLTDTLGGLICAEGILGGLLARTRTGEAQRIDTSLLSAAHVLQGPPDHRAHRWWSPLRRPLETADGYLALSVRAASDPPGVAAACGVGQSAGGQLFERIAERFSQEPSSFWFERLCRLGLGASPVCTDLVALAADPRFSSALQRGACTLPRPPWEFSR